MTRNRQTAREKKVWGEVTELRSRLAGKKLSIPEIYDGWVEKLMKLIGPKGPASRSYRYLARKIEEDLPGRSKGRTLIFTSPGSADLVSDTLMMFSYFLQDELDCNVLIIDGTFRKDGLSKRLMHEESAGLMDLVYGNGTLATDDLIKPTDKNNIFLLPLGNTPKTRFSSPNPEKLKSLLRQFESRFDYVLIQQGSILRDTRYLLFTALADRIFLLVEEGETLVSELEECQRLFREYRLSNVRLIMSRPG